MLNRKGGPERVIDEVEGPGRGARGARAERQAIVGGYAGKARFAVAGNVSPLRGGALLPLPCGARGGGAG